MALKKHLKSANFFLFLVEAFVAHEAPDNDSSKPAKRRKISEGFNQNNY